MAATEVKSSNEQVNERPGYLYSASFGFTSPGAPTADQCVWIKLEISGQIKIVAVCALCHNAFRLCSLDSSVTEEQIASAKYLGLADTATDDKEVAKEDTKEGTKEGTEAEKSDSDKKKESSDSNKTKETSGSDKTKDKSQSDSAKKKKKRSDGGSDQRHKEMPQTSWTTHKPSHDEWDKKKKKDL